VTNVLSQVTERTDGKWLRKNDLLALGRVADRAIAS